LTTTTSAYYFLQLAGEGGFIAMFSRLFAFPALAAAASCLLTGCESVNHVEYGTLTINNSVTLYNNNATILNIVRASRDEPLGFVALTGLTGHHTLTGVASLTVVNHLFTSGPNTATKTNSVDYTANIPDDPVSTSALLTPVDPGTLGFMINQGYPKELIFFLFVKELQIERPSITMADRADGAGKSAIRSEFAIYLNAPFTRSDSEAAAVMRDPGPLDGAQAKAGLLAYQAFGNEVQHLEDEGFTIQVDRFGVPSARGVPVYRACFDPAQVRTPTVHVSEHPIVEPNSHVSCDAEWPIDKLPPADAPTATTSSQAILAVATAITTAAKAGAGAAASKAPQGYWTSGEKGSRIRLTTRSVFEVYRYLGKLLAEHADLALYEDNTIRSALKLKQLRGHGVVASQCFASVAHDGGTWCLPNDDESGKYILAMLRQLTSLYTAPSNQTSTPTVRAISE
jgi:hypothetical protein